MNVSSIIAVRANIHYGFRFINIFLRPAFLWMLKKKKAINFEVRVQKMKWFKMAEEESEKQITLKRLWRIFSGWSGVTVKLHNNTSKL